MSGRWVRGGRVLLFGWVGEARVAGPEGARVAGGVWAAGWEAGEKGHGRGSRGGGGFALWLPAIRVGPPGYASSVLRPTRRRVLWMAWYPQVRECCCLGGGSFHVSGPASICVWALEMAEIQGPVPVDGQRHWIYLARQSMASPRL